MKYYIIAVCLFSLIFLSFQIKPFEVDEGIIFDHYLSESYFEALGLDREHFLPFQQRAIDIYELTYVATAKHEAAFIPSSNLYLYQKNWTYGYNSLNEDANISIHAFLFTDSEMQGHLFVTYEKSVNLKQQDYVSINHSKRFELHEMDYVTYLFYNETYYHQHSNIGMSIEESNFLLHALPNLEHYQYFHEPVVRGGLHFILAHEVDDTFNIFDIDIILWNQIDQSNKESVFFGINRFDPVKTEDQRYRINRYHIEKYI
jgi:hypothetical protein